MSPTELYSMESFVNALLSGDKICQSAAEPFQGPLKLALQTLRDEGYEITEGVCGYDNGGGRHCHARAYWIPAAQLARALEGKEGEE
jgi:hypothetical protein